MPLFGGKHKTLHELVKIIRDGLVVLSSGDVKDEKKIQKVCNDSENFLLGVSPIFVEFFSQKFMFTNLFQSIK